MNYDKELKAAKEWAERKRQKQKIYEAKHKYDKKKELPTHKLVTLYLFVILNIVLFYSLIAMWTFADLTHLGLLITDIMAQVLTFFIYHLHSKSDNQKGSLHYDLMMKEHDSVG